VNGLLGKFSLARKKVWTDILGLDVGGATTRVVRLKRAGDAITLVGADLFPRQAVPALDGDEVRPQPLVMPKPLRAMYAAVAVTSPQASIRLLSAPGGADSVSQLNFNELLGLAEGTEYRIGYEVIASEGREQSVLASALPEKQARWAVSLLPQGVPAPCSLQTAGSAVLNCFARELAARHGDVPAIFVQVGNDVTDLAVFCKGRLALYRQCLMGSQSIVKSVQEKFGIEEELVPGVLEDDLIDASQPIAAAIDPFLRQLVLAREFVERKRACRIEKILLCGAVLGVKHWSEHISRTMGITPQVWNPLTTLPCAPDAVADRVKGMESRFATAIGAALSLLEIESDLPR
jgi:Tfp pilus assembly PilM family ATPase